MGKEIRQEIDRRTFLRLAGGVGLKLTLEASGLGPVFAQQEASRFRTTRAAIDALWNGTIPSIWINIKDNNGWSLLCGSLQVRKPDPQRNVWVSESDINVGWIHILPDDPYAFRGLIFTHRDKLDSFEKTKGRKTLYIYDDRNHNRPVLIAPIGVKANYPVDRFDDPEDPLVKQVTRSLRTMAIVSCHPSDCQGPECPQRLVYYAWASLPK